ncbi:hypothetical protein ACFQDG_17950, partial [Natronoarchaeum mannanilyticum]
MAEEPGDGDRVPDERDDERDEEPSVSSEVEREVESELNADDDEADPGAESDDDEAASPPDSYRPYHKPTEIDHSGDERGDADSPTADGRDAADADPDAAPSDDAVEPSTDRMLPEDDDAGAGAPETRDDDVSKPDVDDITNETGVDEAPPAANGVAPDDDTNGVA